MCLWSLCSMAFDKLGTASEIEDGLKPPPTGLPFSVTRVDLSLESHQSWGMRSSLPQYELECGPRCHRQAISQSTKSKFVKGRSASPPPSIVSCCSLRCIQVVCGSDVTSVQSKPNNSDAVLQTFTRSLWPQTSHAHMHDAPLCKSLCF